MTTTKESYLKSLKASHAKLDEMISELGRYPGLEARALKKKKLALKEKILEVETEIESSNSK